MDKELGKKQEKITKKLWYYIRHMNPGGPEPFTFWEKLKFTGFILLCLCMMFGLYFLLIIGQKH